MRTFVLTKEEDVKIGGMQQFVSNSMKVFGTFEKFARVRRKKKRWKFTVKCYTKCLDVFRARKICAQSKKMFLDEIDLRPTPRKSNLV